MALTAEDKKFWEKKPTLRDKESQTNKTRLRVYGISNDTYNKMFKAQGGCCAICGTHQSELKAPLYIDHCHKSGDVRGLLCSACNSGLGHLKDDTGVMLKAVDYLQNYTAWN
jgi:hypothetical protein